MLALFLGDVKYGDGLPVLLGPCAFLCGPFRIGTKRGAHALLNSP